LTRSQHENSFGFERVILRDAILQISPRVVFAGRRGEKKSFALYLVRNQNREAC
jgi:hypothetical protein